MTQIKAIRIDSANRRFHEVEIEQNNIDDINSHLGSSLFDIVRLDNGDVIFVDDEGILTANVGDPFFATKRFRQALVGNGLVVGTNPKNGDSVDPLTTIEWLEDNVYFGTLVEADHKLVPVRD